MTDDDLIYKIADRAQELYAQYGINRRNVGFIAAEVDIVHRDIIPLRLREMLDADDFNFMHDIAGIHRHLLMYPTPKLTDCFLPRFAKV